MSKHILIVEDDASLSRTLCDNLTLEGFEAEWARDGNTAAQMFDAVAPDLVLLDIGLPDINGWELCQRWRVHGTPIIVVTAKGRKEDKLKAFSLGVDDYITKPFELQELLARVRAVLRRSRPKTERIVLGTVTVDFVKREARDGDRVIELTNREFNVLHYLAERPTSIVRRHELLREVWGYDAAVSTRAVDHAMVRLRRKIEPDPHRPKFVHTMYGDGYCLTPDA
jgi:DNA-binding response OmpR family regulator